MRLFFVFLFFTCLASSAWTQERPGHVKLRYRSEFVKKLSIGFSGVMVYEKEYFSHDNHSGFIADISPNISIFSEMSKHQLNYSIRKHSISTLHGISMPIKDLKLYVTFAHYFKKVQERQIVDAENHIGAGLEFEFPLIKKKWWSLDSVFFFEASAEISGNPRLLTFGVLANIGYTPINKTYGE